jgi:hypothetical protein
MIGTLRRHQSWVWIAAIPIIIVSFVVFYSPAGRSRSGGPKTDRGMISDRPITEQEFRDSWRELEILYFFRNRKWPETADFKKVGIDPEREAYNRILIHELMRKNHVEIPPEAIAAWIKTVFRAGEGEPFNRGIYDTFLAEIARHGARASDLERFARLEIGRDHLGAVFGASGDLVTPMEAQAAFHREHDLMVTEMVTFPATNFLSLVKVDPSALSTYYTNHAADYRIPEKRTASYVAFPYTNYLAEVDKDIASITNLQERLEQQYLQAGVTNFTDEATGRILSKEDALAKMTSDGREQAAAAKARRAAAVLINQIFAATSPTNLSANMGLLRTVAATNDLKVQMSAPFDRNGQPPGLDVPADFAAGAFGITAMKPVPSSPVMGKTAAYVVAQGQIVPSRLQTMAEVQTEVAAAFKASESVRLARDAGLMFATSVTNAANAGKKFSELAAAAGFEVESVPPFSVSSTELPGLDRSLPLGFFQQVGFAMKPGETSPYRQAGRVGVVLHLAERKPADEATLKADLPAFTKRIQTQRQSQAFMDWVNRQAKALNLSLPQPAGS